MEQTKITFMMLAYNSEKTVSKAVKSILNQTEKNINLIVRDNGSTDNTGKILNEIAAKDQRLSVVRNDINWCSEKGKPFTVDGVIRIWPTNVPEFCGDYISIVDSDDWLDKEFSSKMYESAESNNSDITVCGNTFMLNGEKQGVRLPPDIVAQNRDELGKAIGKDYAAFHNTFRTWWGKLYKKEFFLENYEECWKTVGGSNGDVMDTAIMLRYLTETKTFSSVVEPLYNFRESANSTYSTRRKVNPNRSLEGDEIYNAAVKLITSFKIQNNETVNFIVGSHWSYVNEVLDCLKYKHEGATDFDELSGVASLLNSSVFSNYYKSNTDYIFSQVMGKINCVIERNENKGAIYNSYLPRLAYLNNMLTKGEKNILFYQILIGCLYSPENKNKIGFNLLANTLSGVFNLDEVDISQKLSYQLYEMYMNLKSPKFFPNYEAMNIKTQEIEDELRFAFRSNDYKKVTELYEKIIKINPMNKTAMFYLVKLFIITKEDKTLTSVMAATCLELWPDDLKIQRMCMDFFENESEDEHA